MTRRRIQILIRRFAPALPVAMFLTACVVAAVALSSCGRPVESHQPVEPPVPARPLRFEGVPTVRVRLNSTPVSSVDVATTSGYRLFVDGKPAGESDSPLPPTRCRRTGGRWLLGALSRSGDRLTIEPKADGRVQADGSEYRGSLVLHAAGPETLYFHNHVDMESYLASVIAKEMYSHFHPEAYRAQAVAARTYAAYEMADRGDTHNFDVWDSQRSQVYLGTKAETPKSWAAVRSTHGWLLTYGPPGAERVFLSQFSACNGGYVNGAHVLRDVREIIEPLAGGQKDDDGQSFSKYRWPTVRIRKADVYRALARRYKAFRNLGRIASVRVKKSTAYGRPIWLEFSNGRGRTADVRADNLRAALLSAGVPAAKKLYSMNCTIRDAGSDIEFADGRGFGHGVGLSQWGAEDKARRGMTGEEILEFYYPGAAIKEAY